MNFTDFIKPELFILIPVLYFIGEGIKKSAINNKFIPLILGAVGIVVAGIYLFATVEIIGKQAIAIAIFTAITQGILCAAASVYTNQIIKQSLKHDEKETLEDKENTEE